MYCIVSIAVKPMTVLRAVTAGSAGTDPFPRDRPTSCLLSGCLACTLCSVALISQRDLFIFSLAAFAEDKGSGGVAPRVGLACLVSGEWAK